MSDTQYLTKQGDMLDAICFKHYGERPHSVEAVLDANSGLAGYPPKLPAGLIIILPDLGAAIDTSKISLWD